MELENEQDQESETCDVASVSCIDCGKLDDDFWSIDFLNECWIHDSQNIIDLFTRDFHKHRYLHLDVSEMSEIDWKEYFESNVSDSLPLRETCCGDCAVVNGFYGEISDALKQQDDGLKIRASKSWFCHNNTDQACRGNADNCGLSW